MMAFIEDVGLGASFLLLVFAVINLVCKNCNAVESTGIIKEYDFQLGLSVILSPIKLLTTLLIVLIAPLAASPRPTLSNSPHWEGLKEANIVIILSKVYSALASKLTLYRIKYLLH